MHVHPQTPLVHEKHSRTDKVKRDECTSKRQVYRQVNKTRVTQTNAHRKDRYTVKQRCTHVKEKDIYK